jgi:hypothetical protein
MTMPHARPVDAAVIQKSDSLGPQAFGVGNKYITPTVADGTIIYSGKKNFRASLDQSTARRE